jgi:hypothetical protein
MMCQSKTLELKNHGCLVLFSVISNVSICTCMFRNGFLEGRLAGRATPMAVLSKAA